MEAVGDLPLDFPRLDLVPVDNRPRGSDDDVPGSEIAVEPLTFGECGGGAVEGADEASGASQPVICLERLGLLRSDRDALNPGQDLASTIIDPQDTRRPVEARGIEVPEKRMRSRRPGSCGPPHRVADSNNAGSLLAAGERNLHDASLPHSRRRFDRDVPNPLASGHVRNTVRVIAVYAGRFDPVTNGHLDILGRAARLFDNVVVAVYDAPADKSLFSTAKRVSMVQECVEDMPSVSVEAFAGLLTDFVRSRGADLIVRGLRAVTDFSVEFDQALMYKDMAPEIEQVYLMSDLRFVFVRAARIREVAALGHDVSHLVPEVVAAALQEVWTTKA